MRRGSAISALALCVFVSVSLVTGQTRRPWTAPKAGVWTVSGNDEENTRWSAWMHLTRTGGRGSTAFYRGHFYWWSPDSETKGYEYFTGRFDRRTGKLRLHGSRVRSLRGELGIGDYQARLRRGSLIYKGSWAGEKAIPGTWTARWSRSR